MKRDDVLTFERIWSQLHTLYRELSVLSAAQHDAPGGELKVGIANAVLGEARALLPKGERPAGLLADLGPEVTCSDVVVVLAIYVTAFEAVRAVNTKQRHGKLYWVVEGDLGGTESFVPVREPRTG